MAGDLLDAALAYAKAGVPVFPITPGGKAPLIAKAEGGNGFYDATTDPAVVTDWWTRWPTASIGIRTGAASNLVVLDLDGPDGEASLAKLEAEHGPLPASRTVRTPRGGRHVYLAHPGGRVPNRVGTLGPGVDVRGDGGYVVAPPSAGYLVDADASVADLPATLAKVLAVPTAGAGPNLGPFYTNEMVKNEHKTVLAELAPPGSATAYGEAALDGEVAAVAKAAVGARNDRLNVGAFRLGQLVVEGELAPDVAEAALAKAAAQVGLPAAEAEGTIRSGLGGGQRKPRQSDSGAERVTRVSPGHRTADQQHHTSEGGSGDTSDNGDTVKGDSRRTVWTAAELLAADFPEPRWAVPTVVPEGVTLLVGAPKVGKSWLALGIGEQVAAGGVVLGSIQVKQGDVLYLALEDPARRLKARLATLLDGRKAPTRLTLWIQCPPLPEGGDRRIRAWLDQHPGARLVLVDVFTRVRGEPPRGVSAFAADYRAVAQAKAIADDYAVAVVLVHHDRKAPADDFLATISGTNGLAAAADTIMVLKRARGEADAVLHVTGRDVEEVERALRFTPATGVWELLHGPVIEFTATGVRGDVLRWLRQHGAAKPLEIADALDLKPNTVRQTCRRMAEEGDLGTDGAGRYWAPPV